MGYEIITINFIIMDEQKASVTKEDGTVATVDLWEIFGYVRVEDEFTDWKYASDGE